jgi:macrolide transport system ATP-binding/permease protein
MRFEHWVYTIPLRLRSLFRRNQLGAELDEELRDHIDLQIEDNLAHGISPEEARLAALRTGWSNSCAMLTLAFAR